MKGTQTYVAGGLALLTALLIAGAGYLAFIFPRTMVVWAEEGRALTGFEQTLASLSNFFVNRGSILLPALLLIFIVSIAWTMIGVKRGGQGQLE